MKRSLLVLGCLCGLMGRAAADGAGQAVSLPSRGAAAAEGASTASKQGGSLTASGLGEEYVLGPEDKLRILVIGHSEYSLETAVGVSGKIAYPIPAGELQVAGKTRAQVQEMIREALKFDLRNPMVTVDVAQQRPHPVYLTGMGAATLEWQRGWRVRDALAKTGGIKGKLEQLQATLRHPNGERIPIDLKKLLVENDEAADLPLQPGDQLDIQEIPLIKVYVLGEVKAEGMRELLPGQGVTQAIATSGGVTNKAALEKAIVIRGSQTFPVNLRPLLKQGRLPDAGLKLETDDVIVVPEYTAKVNVLGNVPKPGPYDLPEGERVTVMNVLSMAGWVQGKTKLSEVYIMRSDGEKAQKIPVDIRAVMKGELAKDQVVQPNDIVFVPKSGRMEPFDGLWLMQGVDWVLNLFKFGL